MAGHHLAGAPFHARCRLHLDVQRMAIRQAVAADVLQRRQGLAGIDPAVPAAGVQLRQFAPPIVAADHARGPAEHLARIGGPLQRRVVQQERHAVGRQLDVAFEHPVAVAGADPERSQRVFRRQLAGAAVGNPAGIRPGFHSVKGVCRFRRRTSATGLRAA